jgi:glucokinase
MMLLAADIGGTKTLLGLFEPASPRPIPFVVRSFRTLDYADLTTMVAEFLRGAGVASSRIITACAGVAGPILNEVATVTNIAWKVDAPRVASAIGFGRLALLNDLEAVAYAVPALQAAELDVLQVGTARPGGNIALIAPGTGLGEGLLHSVDGRFVPSPSEGGHADFSARTEREIALLRDLTTRYGRADVEHVVSGRGIVNIHRVMHAGPCAADVNLGDDNAPAAITAAAFDRRCPGCVETLDLFVEAYGAETGNLALRTVSTGGVFLGGGITPKILPALTTGAFLRAFLAKPPLGPMLSAMPVAAILNAEAGLLGAAIFAARG